MAPRRKKTAKTASAKNKGKPRSNSEASAPPSSTAGLEDSPEGSVATVASATGSGTRQSTCLRPNLDDAAIMDPIEPPQAVQGATPEDKVARDKTEDELRISTPEHDSVTDFLVP